MPLKQITDFGPPKKHFAANRASVISQALCRSHARFTCKLEDTSRNVPKALISGGSNNRKLFICSLSLHADLRTWLLICKYRLCTKYALQFKYNLVYGFVSNRSFKMQITWKTYLVSQEVVWRLIPAIPNWLLLDVMVILPKCCRFYQLTSTWWIPLPNHVFMFYPGIIEFGYTQLVVMQLSYSRTGYISPFFNTRIVKY